MVILIDWFSDIIRQLGFSDEVVWKVWAKGYQTENDPLMWRKDECGAWIFRGDYGKNSQYGWEIDHIVSVSEGGTDDLPNLRPLHCENTVRAKDGSLACPVTSEGAENVRRTV